MQDESDDPTVSFKTPTKVPVSRATRAVVSHEQEHVAHERAKAAKEGYQVSIRWNPERPLKEKVNGPADMTLELERKIVQLKELRPNMDVRGLKALLYQQEGVDVKEGEIERILRKYDLFEDSIKLGPSIGSMVDLVA